LNIALTSGKCYDHLVHFVLIWCIFSGFGITYKEKSGKPAIGNRISRAYLELLFENNSVESLRAPDYA
jgi:hypothetical protein